MLYGRLHGQHLLGLRSGIVSVYSGSPGRSHQAAQVRHLEQARFRQKRQVRPEEETQTEATTSASGLAHTIRLNFSAHDR